MLWSSQRFSIVFYSLICLLLCVSLVMWHTFENLRSLACVLGIVSIVAFAVGLFVIRPLGIRHVNTPRERKELYDKISGKIMSRHRR